ncbi:MAG: decarboxylating 6-phosphogluconate dehydrogenase [Anaerolineales bacterium]|nr:decarboxylating 6-phosphogluconate dehydrogenase [Anaerolineales bacterium]MCW5838364.1 decarboxylating 6-phosphogluconate dehydrogenase [Anaerolineales bacterium]MCW5888631.1 decarboxylating 6-phosphogluconate dehydrogenase [Anaerolineales bacterium]
MKIAMIGLGRMGGNMSRRLLQAGHQVVGYNLDDAATRQLQQEAGLLAAFSLAEAVAQLDAPRTVWLMLPAGEATESTLEALLGLLSPGDVVVDGGNANFRDSMRRAARLAEHGIDMLDVGVSGGVWGLENGYGLMVGGAAAAAERLAPLFAALAPEPQRGWGRVGPSGAGHYVKMVHNGIEYALMQAYAEGFELLATKEEFALDLHQVAEMWRHGTVIRSWLLDLAARALESDAKLTDIAGYVQDSGEGRWTVFEAINQDVPAPTITLALMQRFASRQPESFANKLIAALRNQFGGHAVKKAE